jgi:hypothetical protein
MQRKMKKAGKKVKEAGKKFLGCFRRGRDATLP